MSCIVHKRLPKDGRPTGIGKRRRCRFHGGELVEHLVCLYCVDRHDLVDNEASDEIGMRPFKVCPASDEFWVAFALMARDGA